MSLKVTSLVVLSLSVCLQAETLGVYLDKPLSGPTADSFRTELHNLLKDTGVSIQLRSLKDRRAGESFDRLMVVQLRGACAVTEESTPQEAAGPLASTQVEGSRILPYTEIFCGRMRQTLASALDRQPLYRRNVLTGRALARILAHEIYHYLAQDTNHGSDGIAKRCFSGGDLLTDELTFDHPTLSRLQSAVDPPAFYTETEGATGR